MNRKKQIYDAFFEELKNTKNQLNYNSFQTGALWADKHPEEEEKHLYLIELSGRDSVYCSRYLTDKEANFINDISDALYSECEALSIIHFETEEELRQYCINHGI